MFRSGWQRLALPLVQTRSYSQGFDVSQFLTRIEAATKQKPVRQAPRKLRAKVDAADSNKRPDGQTKRPNRPYQNASQRSAGQRATNAGHNAYQNASQRPDGQRTASAGQRTTDQRNAGQRPAGQHLAGKRPVQRAGQLSAASGVQAEAEWTALDSSSRALPRSNRRSAPRKPGSKAKASSRTASKRAPRKVGSTKTVPDRQYVPYLTPEEALNVVLRNEGTSNGGFITPYDVSLQSLQPNFVVSAVSYNARLRSLLNAATPGTSSVANKETRASDAFNNEPVAELMADKGILGNDPARLKALVDRYVSGEFDACILPASEASSLSNRGLVSEVNANPSMDFKARKFFADVGAGKVSPRQIAQHP